MWSNTDSRTLLIRMQKDAATLEDHLAVSYTSERILPIHGPAVMLLGTYPEALRSVCPHKCLPRMFTAAVFVTAKPWEHLRCPLVSE